MSRSYHQFLEDNKVAFANALLSWFHCHKRSLPWRENPTLYKTVVSEFMLQQTQVDTVLPYFERWIQAFPSFDSLAQAEESLVMKHWEGLGYYSRARNLHKLAKAYVQVGSQPQAREEWLKFPGIGPYTSAAITSIALGKPHAVIDGNVIRVLSRLANVHQEFKDNTAAMKFFTPLADVLIDPQNPGAYNEAMMELGAKICSKANPQCLLCPVKSFCQAKNPETLPKWLPKKTTAHEIFRAICIHDNQILLHKIPKHSKRLANILEFPEIAQSLAKQGEFVATKKRGISNQRFTEHLYRLDSSLIKHQETFEWVHIQDINQVVLSGPHKKWLVEVF